jgi:hypothetical protein
LFRGNRVLSYQVVEHQDPALTFTGNLEACLIELCHDLDVPLPLWLDKNTREFARFHQTLFFAGQFIEPVAFDRFQIRWID